MGIMLTPPPWLEWLREVHDDPSSRARARLHDHSLAALTGQDHRALAAVAASWVLYAASDEDGAAAALDAIRHLLPAMQHSAWHVARSLIAYAMDWSDMDRLWPLVAVDGLAASVVRCSW